MLHQIILKYRWIVITALVAVIFINWYFYLQSYTYVKEWLFKALVSIGLDSVVSLQTIKNILSKGLAVLLLALQNACLSMLIVYVYFRKDMFLVRIAVWILGIYTLACLGWSLTAHIAGWNYLYAISREALDTLASPLIEITLIPVLHLYKASLSQKHT
jgi:hypothetical protein